MSYYVRQLLMDSYMIRSSIVEKSGNGEIVNINFDSDQYNDLLIVEKKIKELRASGNISELEENVITGYVEQITTSNIARKYKISRELTRKLFKDACNKVAFSLGGEYTDCGFIEYFSTKHKLNEEQTKQLAEIVYTNRKV